MQLTINKILLFWILSANIVWADIDIIEQKTNELTHSQGSSFHAAIATMTPEMRSAVISKLHDNLNKRRYDEIDQPSYNVLVTLNDEAAIQAMVDAYHQGSSLGESVLEWSAREGSLGILAHDVVNGATDFRSEGDSRTLSIRDQSTLLMLNAIARSEVFSADARAWADKLAKDTFFNRVNFDYANNCTKNWWSHNREAVLSRHYNEATWLPLQDEHSSSQLNLNSTTDQKNVEIAAHELDHLQNLSSAQNKQLPSWLYAIAAFCLTGIIGFWYQMKRKK